MVLESYMCDLCILQKEEKLMLAPDIGIFVPTWLKPDKATRYIKRKLNSLFAMKIIILMC
jgi:hypothetical protein